jgi:hypothetical protein
VTEGRYLEETLQRYEKKSQECNRRLVCGNINNNKRAIRPGQVINRERYAGRPTVELTGVIKL